METLVLMACQIGLVIAAFVGVSTAIGWYHKGGKSDGKHGSPLSSKNLR